MAFLSKNATEAKHQFLNKHPHLYSNQSPTFLDEHLELIEEYFKAVNAEKKTKKTKRPKEAK